MDIRKLLYQATSDLDTSDDSMEAALMNVRAEALQGRARRSTTAAPRFDEVDGKTADAPYPRRGRRRLAVTGVIAAALLAVGGFALAQNQPSEDEVADQYGLTKHFEKGPGEFTSEGVSFGGRLIDDVDCQPTAGKVSVIQEVGDGFYCITADSRFEAWMIGRELLGETPSEEEIERAREAFASDEAGGGR